MVTPIPVAAPNWRAWVKDFFHGRTHVAYGLIISTLTSSVAGIIAPDVLLRLLCVVSAVVSAGALTDTVAHLFYH